MLELAPLLVSALILGLLGGGHCLGMCGGLMGALTLAIPKEQRSRRFRLLLAYNLGRILSYATAGLLIGLAGWAVANSPAALFMRVLAGLLLIAMGLYLAGWWSGLTRRACPVLCCLAHCGAGCRADWFTARCCGQRAKAMRWTVRC